MPVSVCFTGSHCNTVAIWSPLAHVLRGRGLCLQRSSSIFDRSRWRARARLSLTVALFFRVLFGLRRALRCCFWRGDVDCCLGPRRRELTVRFGDVELCDDDRARARTAICCWVVGLVWDRGRPRLAHFPFLTAAAHVGEALIVQRARTNARRSSLTLLVSSAGGVSIFVVWRGAARARLVALSLVTLATAALPLAPGCQLVRLGARALLAVALLPWDRRSRLDE